VVSQGLGNKSTNPFFSTKSNASWDGSSVKLTTSIPMSTYLWCHLRFSSPSTAINPPTGISQNSSLGVALGFACANTCPQTWYVVTISSWMGIISSCVGRSVRHASRDRRSWSSNVAAGTSFQGASARHSDASSIESCDSALWSMSSCTRLQI